MRNDKENIIVTLTLEFSVEAVCYCELLDEFRKFTISNQLLKSATSIGANVREAQNAESKADFIHKLKIAAKEADETDYWLTICKLSKNYPDTTELQTKLQSIIKILSKIISTSKS
jgi:four helix bundle protein